MAAEIWTRLLCAARSWAWWVSMGWQSNLRFSRHPFHPPWLAGGARTAPLCYCVCAHDLAGLEFHDAYRVDATSVIGDHILATQVSPPPTIRRTTKPPRGGGMAAKGLHVVPSANLLPRLWILDDGIFVIDLVFRVLIARSRRLPMPPRPHGFLDRTSHALILNNSVLTSLSSRNKPRNTGFHNGIKPDPQVDSFANLAHSVIRKCGDVKVLRDSGRRFRSGQERRPALDGPGEQDLGRGLVDPPGDGGDDRIFQQLGFRYYAPAAANACNTMPFLPQ